MTLNGSNLCASLRCVLNGYDLAQTTDANKPLYVAATASEPAYLLADGTDDSMTWTTLSSDIPVGSTACEEWALCRQDSTDPNVPGTLMATGGSSSGSTRRTYKSGVLGINRFCSDLSATGNTASKINTDVVALGWHVVRSVYGTNFVRTDVDGIAGQTFAATPSITNARTRIFSSGAASPSSFWTGALSDRLITMPLTDAQARQMWAYFARVLAGAA